MHAPGFFDVEVASVLWKKVRRGELPPGEVPDMLDDLRALPLTRHPDHELVRAAFDIAHSTGRTVYDSMYVALAVRLGGKTVTADEKLRNALQATRWAAHLLWVEDIP